MIRNFFQFYWVVDEYFRNPSENRPKYTNADFVDSFSDRHRYRRIIKYRKEKQYIVV